jgi:hypothetical protein
MPRQNPPWTINIHLKKKGQEGKMVTFWGLGTSGRRGHKERVKEGEYGRYILYSCMKIE